MDKNLDFGILDLNSVAKVVGPHLDLKNLLPETAGYLKKNIPCKKIRFLLWDDLKKKFSSEFESGKKAMNLNPKVTAETVKLSELREPAVTKKGLVIPFRYQDKLLGVALIEGRTPDKFLNQRESIKFLTSFLGIVLTNAKIFIDSETHNLDMFRFNVLSRALNPTVNQEDVARILIEGLEGIIKFDVVGLLINGKSSSRMYVKSKRFIRAKVVDKIRDDVLQSIYNLTRRTIDMEKFKERIIIAEGRPKDLKIKSFLNAPLITKDKVIGVLNLYAFEKDQFSARDIQNISILASHGAVAFENSLLYEDLRRTYFSIINALTSAIEAKDEYTRGHSVLVSKFSVAIASEMGLSSSMIESIQIAGLLHDLGKIGVPEEILVKKGKLTDSEYQIVKAHPEIAMKILGPVEFPHFTQYDAIHEISPEVTLSFFEQADLSEDVKLMIYHHHEKYAGGGYPTGIKKEEIPLGARILSVADTFEALTANRPYRQAFSTEEAKKVLNDISGQQLDPNIVSVFMRLLEKRGIEVLKTQGTFF